MYKQDLCSSFSWLTTCPFTQFICNVLFTFSTVSYQLTTSIKVTLNYITKFQKDKLQTELTAVTNVVNVMFELESETI